MKQCLSYIIIILFGGACVLLTGCGSTQTTLEGTIDVQVIDTGGIPITGASVVLEGEFGLNGVIPEAVFKTDPHGEVTLSDLPVGSYHVIVLFQGHTFRSRQIIVQAGQHTAITITVQP